MSFAKVRRLTWPDTFGRRLLFAMAIHQPLAFLSVLLVGWFKQLPLAVTMLEIWIWVFVIATVISVGQAAAARPGASFWKPLFGTSASDSR